MNNVKTILIFGLPGVGKTTVIKNLVDNRGDCIRLSGGSLINQELNKEDRDALRKLDKQQVLYNQEVLVRNFLKEKAINEDKHILFDGHCIIKDKDYSVEVPTTIIERLQPDAILFIYDNPDEIYNRRQNDNKRINREDETIKQITENQEKQKNICENYATILNTQFKTITPPISENFISIIEEILYE